MGIPARSVLAVYVLYGQGMTIGESMRPKPRSFRDGQAGFTLIELVVVVGLIGVVLAILVMGVRRASDAFSLRKAATTVISEVRRAQSSAVADGVDYMVEFALANPGRINTYRTKLLTETCPTGMLPIDSTGLYQLDSTSTLCRRAIVDPITFGVQPPCGLPSHKTCNPDWPSSVAINGGGTTFTVCSPPANVANKCVTFQPLGFAVAGGTVQLLSRTGVSANLAIAAATGRVSVGP